VEVSSEDDAEMDDQDADWEDKDESNDDAQVRRTRYPSSSTYIHICTHKHTITHTEVLPRLP